MSTSPSSSPTGPVPSPSGRNVELVHGPHHAVITEVGAAVRRYDVDGRPVFAPFGADEIAPAFHGAVLAPWPNRLADGVYGYGGKELQVALTEPSRATALHGLTPWARWEFTEITDTAATLGLDLVPTPGYPFQLRLEARYELGDGGLGVSVRAHNIGDRTAPYGIGFHPWLSPGKAPLDECTFTLDARTRVLTDDRLLPTGTESPSGGYDLAAGQLLAGVELDDAYLHPTFDADGRSWARLASPDGSTAAIWTDRSASAWQVCTGDAIADPARRRGSIAAEPMTCIADAFRTGDLLIELAPGESHEIRWGALLI